MHTHEGGCHCRKVRFTVKTDLANVIACNCSYCQAKGFLLTFVPASDFTLLSGTDDLTEYRFNKKHIEHLFCSTCGVQSFGRGKGPDGTEMVAVNVRCLDTINLEDLAITPFAGKDI